MGKRAHGRLVHEVREALCRAGFMPTRITWLDGPGGARAVRAPGFKVEKHNDGKSVRLSHVRGGFPAERADRRYEPPQVSARVNKLDAYSRVLEQDGFIRIAFDGGDRIPGRVAIFQPSI